MYGVGAAAPAAVKEIKIALVYPLSGAMSRNGNLCVQSVKAAMNWVNDNGGIKSLGGAKLVPVVVDAGSTTEGAGNAMERVMRDPSIVMAMGSWASSSTLASTEVTERMGVPQFSSGAVDTLHKRGFKWGFYVAAPMSLYPELGVTAVLDMAKAAGTPIKTVMIIGDNQAASIGFADEAKKTFARIGVKVVGQETWAASTLTDATPVMQKVKAANPDLIVFCAGSISETQLCLMKKRELGIKAPLMTAGGFGGDPTLRAAGAENLEGMIALTCYFPSKATPQEWIKRSLDQCRKEYSDEPWVGQELFEGWTEVPIMAEILERAGSIDRQAIWDTARKLDISNVMATRAIAGQGMAFDDTGRIAKKYQKILVVQWQKGVPRVVFPAELAVSKPEWPKN
jgi:branched-chain amino acid transport system substrate-binding protein